MKTQSTPRKWPTKDTFITFMFLVLFLEQVWIFFYRDTTGVYKTTHDISWDLGFMTFTAAATLFFVAREHTRSISKKS